MSFLKSEFKNDGFDINVKEPNNPQYTALMIAALTGEEASVDWLIENGAELQHTVANEKDGLDAAGIARTQGFDKIADKIEKAMRAQGLTPQSEKRVQNIPTSDM